MQKNFRYSPHQIPIKNLNEARGLISILQMNHYRIGSEVLKAIQRQKRDKISEINIEFDLGDTAVFPNACAPLHGIIQYFRNNGLTIKYLQKSNDNLALKTIFEPINIRTANQYELQNPLNRLWSFSNSEEVSSIVDMFLNEISKSVVCGAGVIDGLGWSLNETMDNVIQHSGTDSGVVMGQIHRNARHIAFCINDIGVGIYNTLKGSIHSPRSSVDAITLAIRKGVTRDKRIGQGNGLWGLHSIVSLNEGSIGITSGTASYIYAKSKTKTHENIPSLPHKGLTTVDFQIDYAKEIQIEKALGGHKPINLRLENLEDERGITIYKLCDQTSGTGTRQSGERIRIDIINIITNAKKAVVIDFEGISVISSSFADELVGKFISEYGLYGFQEAIRMKNMNGTVQAILNRSVAQRMYDAFVERIDIKDDIA